MNRCIAIVATLLAGIAIACPAVAASVDYDFDVTLNPATRLLTASGTVTLPAGEATALALSDRFDQASAFIGDQRLAQAPIRYRLRGWRVPASTEPRVVTVYWQGTLEPLESGQDHRATLDASKPVSDPRGSFLPARSVWYPQPSGSGLATHHVTLRLPPGQRGLVAGELMEERDDVSGYRARYSFDEPGEGIDLIAGPYRVDERIFTAANGRPLRLRTWFFDGMDDLADGYLDAVQDYIARYETQIGAYPFTEFSVVASPTPTGFGMPTLTYLGADVLRLPFIRSTSLGHEVLHNWWGNGVYPHYGRGNWSEGLTTFMADYAFKERESAAAARDMRLGWLREYAAIPESQEFPLRMFTARSHGTSQIVGYNKAAMLFSMLRDRIGRQDFESALQKFWQRYRFRTADWESLLGAFEDSSGEVLAPWLNQWLDRSGAPQIRLSAAWAAPESGQWRLHVRLEQGTPTWMVDVPVCTGSGDQRSCFVVMLTEQTGTGTALIPQRPDTVELDPDLRALRRLGPDEAPPIFRDTMLDDRVETAVLSAPDTPFAEAARTLAGAFLDGPVRLLDAAAELPRTPVLVVGTPASITEFRRSHQLPPPPAMDAGTASATVWAERVGTTTFTFVSAQDADALAALAKPLPHYGRQSWLAFDGAKVVARGVWPGKVQQMTVELP